MKRRINAGLGPGRFNVPDIIDKRCAWCAGHDVYRDYHDREWGVPCSDDQRLFEFLILESAQAGLSWLTILKKRDGYRRAFANFDASRVARFTARDIETLCNDPGIVRNRAKIRSAVTNAQAFLRIKEDAGSFARFAWSFVDGRPRQNRWRHAAQVPTTTPAAEALARELKARGFSFVGPRIVYARMQSMGLVNDHLTGCVRRRECEEAGAIFRLP